MVSALEVHELSKRYGSQSGVVEALDGVSLVVSPGSIFGLLGSNGAGKTTLIEIAVGLRNADSGSIKIFGKDPVVERDWIRSHVGLQPQKATFFPHQKVRELLSFWRDLYQRSHMVDEIVQWLGMQDLLDRRVAKLSGGQHQRLNVALALLGKPDIVFLDEPTTGLDVIARERLWKALRLLADRGTAVVLSTHNLDEASRLCDDIAILDKGKVIAQGSPQLLVRKYAEEVLVSFTLSADTKANIQLELASLGAVVQNGKEVTLRAKNIESAVSKLGGLEGIINISIKEPGLNEVFKNLVGYELGQDYSEQGE